MHDAASLEAAGLPCACVVSSAFAAQAKYQAEMLGLPDVPVAFVRHPVSNATGAEMGSKAEESYSTVLALLQEGATVEAPDWATAAPQGCSS